MSDLMFNETPVGDKPFYKFGDWKEYAIHDEQNVKGFFGEYRWLSNFEMCDVYYEGLSYPSSENAYQAAKLDKDYRHHLQCCSAAASKKVWKKYPKMDSTSEEWDKRKYEVMSVIIFDKFFRNKELRQALIDTDEKFLEETNHWKDGYWGVDIKLGGQNHLGKILMKTRSFWK
jgi:ribA/ribD-fused uncharacterized protein